MDQSETLNNKTIVETESLESLRERLKRHQRFLRLRKDRRNKIVGRLPLPSKEEPEV
jgi:hypothetical protein